MPMISLVVVGAYTNNGVIIRKFEFEAHFEVNDVTGGHFMNNISG